MYAQNYLRETICRVIQTGSVVLPVSLERQIQTGLTDQEEITFKELGFMYPVVLFPTRPERIIVLDPRAVLELENQFRIQMLQRNMNARGGIGDGMGDIGGIYMGGSSPANMRGSSVGAGAAGIGSEMRGGMRGMTQNYSGFAGGAGRGYGLSLGQIAGNLNEDQKLALFVYNFVIQFIWIETPPSERDRIKAEKEQAVLLGHGTNSGTHSKRTLSLVPETVLRW